MEGGLFMVEWTVSAIPLDWSSPYSPAKGASIACWVHEQLSLLTGAGDFGQEEAHGPVGQEARALFIPSNRAGRVNTHHRYM